MRTMKIGLAGTHSTGKSTFLSCLRKPIQDLGLTVSVISDNAALASEKGFQILRGHTWESTLWIIAHGIQTELEAERKSQVVLVDRVVADALGYLDAALDVRGEVLRNWQRGMLENLVREYTRSYHKTFKTQIDPTMPIDQSKPRDLDPEFRRTVAGMIDQVFERLDLPFESLTSANAATKRKEVLYALQTMVR